MKKFTFLLAFIFLINVQLHAQTVSILPAGSSWKYLDKGTNQGSAWRAVGFNDSSWVIGNAQLGYGDGDEATVVSYGTNSSAKFITTYFRKTFSVSNPTSYSSYTLSLMRDDGAVVYLNGTEVARSNMPSGTISYTRLASGSVSGSNESAYYTFNLSASSFVSGNNVLAVEVHQNAASSSDLSFNLKLDATTAASCNTPGSLSTSSIASSSAVLSWASVSGATNYNIRYRTVGAASWTSTTSSSTTKSLASLLPATQYEFQVQAVCSATGSFSASANFTTLAATCGTPGSLSASSVTTSSASLSWSAVTGATGYNIRYRTVGAASWTASTSSTTTKSLTGLLQGTQYEFQMQAVCSVTGSYSASANFITLVLTGSDTLISANSSWKYLDNGTDQGVAWRSSTFEDASWASGNAELGYGDGGEATTVSYGANSSAKYITTYFRKAFTISNPSSYPSLTLGVVRDDGVVVYLNGTEVYRNNLPSGTVLYNTLSPTAIGSSDESAWNTISFSGSALVAGTNVVAVEIHQQSASSSDISFNARLFKSGALPTPVVTRGAYLQKLTPNSITIRWRTNSACDSRILYGTSLAYGSSVSDATSTTEHTLTLTGLTPATNYFYSIGTSAQVLQGDSKNNFFTASVTGSTAPVRVWVIGDFGNGSTAQTAVRDAYVNYTGSTPTNLWLWLGDNAYSTGTDSEFQNYVFAKYPDQMKSFPLFPSPGNHDYGSASYQSSSALTTNFPYFSIFSVPQAGEAGGVPSGSPKYYSFNYGNIHFISLDSYGALNTTSSPMYTWLSSDLAANTQRWTVVYFHHPPYSKGAHDSDDDNEMIKMRTNIVPLLESYHVDVVLCGHSHSNERSYLIKGHFGTAGTFTPAMKVSTATNTFVKSAPFNGTVYAVCGTSGQGGEGMQPDSPMPCMYYTNNTKYCSLVMDVNGDNLSCKYLASNGTIADEFSINKVGARSMAPVQGTVEDNFSLLTAGHEIAISYFLEEDADVKIELLNLSGERINSFDEVPAMQTKGFYRFEFMLEEKSVATGIYFVRMTSNGKSFVKKVLVSF